MAIFALVLAGSAANAQSLAEVARQERERQQRVESRIVITNSTLNPGVPGGEPPSPAQIEEPQQKAPEAPATPPADTRDEKWWRLQFQTARGDLKRAEDQLAVLQLDFNRANRDYLQRSDIYNRENRLSVEIAQIKSRMEMATKDAERARQRISELEEELRRANAPAGWAR
jgi:hypothetical protein